MFELKAEVRQEKNPRELRRQGRVPGVVYGAGGFHRLISFSRPELESLLAKVTRSSRISLVMGGERFDTFIREIQYDLLTDRVIHVDLYRPPAERPIRMEVPIRLRGEAKGRKSGGIVEQVREVVLVRGRSAQIPALIELDITELDIGQALHARELKLPEGVQLLTPPEAVLVTILAPRKLEELAPVEAVVAEEGAVPEGASSAEGAAPEPAGAEQPGKGSKPAAPKELKKEKSKP